MLKMMLFILSSSLLAQVPTGPDSRQLGTALEKLKRNAGASTNVVIEIAKFLSKGNSSSGTEDLISDPFCVALRGVTCAQLQRVEEDAVPVHFFHRDNSAIYIIADAISDGVRTTFLFTFTKQHGEYVPGQTKAIFQGVAATAEELSGAKSGVMRLLVKGPESNANDTPISVAIVDINGSDARIIYKQQHLFEGEVSHKGNIVTIQARVPESGLAAPASRVAVVAKLRSGKAGVQLIAHEKPVAK